MQEAAAVDGDGGFEAGIETGGDAGEIAAPTDAGDCGAVDVDFGEAADQRVRAEHGGDGVVFPLLGHRLADGEEFFGVGLVGAAVGETDAVFALVDVGPFQRTVAGEVGRDGGVAAPGPEGAPFAERGAASAVNEDDRREVFVRRGVAGEGAGGGVVGENSRRAALVGFVREEQGADGGAVVFPFVMRGLEEFVEVPGAGGRIGGVCGGRESDERREDGESAVE